MSILGAYIRIDRAKEPEVRKWLKRLEGVEVVELNCSCIHGLTIKSDSLEAAQNLLLGEIARISGVLGVWPLYVQNEEMVLSEVERPSLEAAGESDLCDCRIDRAPTVETMFRA